MTQKIERAAGRKPEMYENGSCDGSALRAGLHEKQYKGSGMKICNTKKRVRVMEARTACREFFLAHGRKAWYDERYDNAIMM